MKFLLAAVNAKYIHSNPAVVSLRAFAVQKSPVLAEHIELTEYTINQQQDTVLADVYAKRPDAIGFSCYIWNITYILELAAEIKKLLPEVDIWLGGPEVSFDAPELLIKYPFLTGIMVGEGEETFYELIKGYVEGKRVSGIITPPRLTDLSGVPFLYDDLSAYENRIIYYESSRGCPFRCSYCLSSIDKTVRLRDIELVKKELDFFLEQKVPQVKFIDRTFNCNKAHAMAVWQYLLEHDNGITNFHFEIAADILWEEELELLAKFRPGAVQLEIGVQSTNEATLKEIDRHMNVEKLKKVVKRLHDGHNIHIHLDLIAGLPYEDYNSFKNSFNEVYSCQPEQLQLGFLKVLKGSKMQEKAVEYGLVYHDRPPYEVLYTNWLSYEDVSRLKRIEEMVELYYNSNQFTTTLPLVVKLFESPFDFFEALADYFFEKGYFTQAPARSYRYQVLLEFIESYITVREAKADGSVVTKLLVDNYLMESELYRQTLTIDLYLRENCKTRPDFAKDLSAEKDLFRELYRKEAETHELFWELYADCDSKALARAVHIEPVEYDFETGERLKEKRYFLFDYRTRSRLTGEARVIEWCGRT